MLCKFHVNFNARTNTFNPSRESQPYTTRWVCAKVGRAAGASTAITNKWTLIVASMEIPMDGLVMTLKRSDYVDPNMHSHWRYSMKKDAKVIRGRMAPGVSDTLDMMLGAQNNVRRQVRITMVNGHV